MTALPPDTDKTQAHLARRGLLAGLSTLAVAGCAPVSLLNTFAGGEAGTRRVSEGIAFGDHPRQRLDVYAPLQTARPPPVVCFIYGGSWNSGSRADYAFMGHALAGMGYVAVVPDYRVVPEVRFPDFLDDNAAAVRWIARNASIHGGDQQRMAIVGHSAGAYNAVMLGADRRYLARAGVQPATVRAVVGLSGPYDFYPWTSRVAEDAFAQWPRPAETQPVNLARSGTPPMLLATGEADDTVLPRNTRRMVAALRAAGAPVEERYYPGVGHAGTITPFAPNFRGGAAVVDDVRRFLAARLGRTA